MAQHGLTYRLSRAFAGTERVWKLGALVLLFVLLSAAVAAVAGVADASAGPDWSVLWQSLVFGLLAGWILAVLRQKTWLAALLVLLLGLIYILLFSGGLIDNLVAIAGELVRLSLYLVTHLKNENIDFAPLLGRMQDLSDAAGVILGRVAGWTRGLLGGRPVFDPVAAALVWNLLLWLVAAWSGWIVEARRSAFLAMLPSVVLSVGSLAYAGRLPIVLYLMLGSVLMLLTVIQGEDRQRAWDESGVAYPSGKNRQVVGLALVIAVGLVVASACLSSISIQRIQEWIAERRKPATQQSDDLAKSLGIVPGGTAVSDTFGPARSPGLPRDLLIGSGPELSQRVVMTVVVRNLASLAGNGQTPPFYWRSFTYDVYTGHGWSSSQTEQTRYDPNQQLDSGGLLDHVFVRQDIFPVENSGGVLYVAGEPYTVNMPVEAAWRQPDDLFGIQMDHSGPYQELSSVPLIDPRVLRDAGQRYPDWVRQRFLTLPPNLPDRVRALALQLTATRSTPYDRAKAIETYLRTYPYTLDVPRPDLSRDLVDYFLFDLKQGYCDYYASAMVVLARAAGVPARLAVGYANGTYNLNSGRFVVTEADAHTWAEIYFPGIGWVPFEPTAARPTFERTAPIQPPTSRNPEHPAGMSKPASGVSSPWTKILFPVAGSAVLLALAWVVFDEIRLRRFVRQGRTLEIYRRLQRLGKSLHVPALVGDTPYEYAGTLKGRLQVIARQSGNAAPGLQVVGEVDKIIHEIVDMNYRPSHPRNLRLLVQWRSLRWRLRVFWLRQQGRLIIGHFKTTIG